MSAPVNGRVWLVRFQDHRGETVTRVYRQRPAAEDYMAAIRQAGGKPALYRSPVEWTPVAVDA